MTLGLHTSSLSYNSWLGEHKKILGKPQQSLSISYSLQIRPTTQLNYGKREMEVQNNKFMSASGCIYQSTSYFNYGCLPGLGFLFCFQGLPSSVQGPPGCWVCDVRNLSQSLHHKRHVLQPSRIVQSPQHLSSVFAVSLSDKF